MNQRKRSAIPRDQVATPFSAILADLCAATGAHCAALVDREGETVDYGGDRDPFDIRVLAAEMRLVLQLTDQNSVMGAGRELMVRARKKSFWMESLPSGYALVLELGRRAAGLSNRALSEARRRLCQEAGFDQEIREHEAWVRVSVSEEPGTSRRPCALHADEAQHPVTVLGRIPSDSTRERAFRVRLDTGEERNLVRESLGRWYLEEDLWG